MIGLASNINGSTVSIQKLNTIVDLLKNTTTTFSVKDIVGIQSILEQGKESKTQEEVLQEVNTDINNLKLVILSLAIFNNLLRYGTLYKVKTVRT